MQRLRQTGSRLEVMQDVDVVTFSSGNAGVRVNLKASAMSDSRREQVLLLEGRDNMRDLASWFMNLTARQTDGEPVASSFGTHTIDEFSRVAAVSIAPNVLIWEQSEGVEVSRPRTRVETDTADYPLVIPDGVVPVLLLNQTYDKLRLQFDKSVNDNPMPLEAMQQLGAWTLLGLEEIKKKSLWS